jgi:hypothetical protein
VFFQISAVSVFSNALLETLFLLFHPSPFLDLLSFHLSLSRLSESPSPDDLVPLILSKTLSSLSTCAE